MRGDVLQNSDATKFGVDLNLHEVRCKTVTRNILQDWLRGRGGHEDLIALRHPFFRNLTFEVAGRLDDGIACEISRPAARFPDRVRANIRIAAHYLYLSRWHAQFFCGDQR